MKSIQTSLLLFAAVFLVSAAPNSPIEFARRDVDPNLVPEFGLQAGLNPTGSGDCDGIPNAAGVPIKVPCSCPPPRSEFIKALNANVAANRAVNNTAVPVSFPTGNDESSESARMNTAIVTLQNFLSKGVGCPAACTTFSAQLKAIQDGTDTTSPTLPSPTSLQSQASPTPTPSPSSDLSSGGVDPNLVPPFGHLAGLNPTGSGDCDGTPNAAGQPIKVPCTCPPNRSDFIKALSANVAAGHAVHNTVVSVTFPTGDDKASKLARINAALDTLQNLNGPGVGCPASSTTFVAQQQAILQS